MAGQVGLAAAGLHALQGGAARDPQGVPALAEAVLAWRRPRALLEAGRAMAGVVRAAVDVSDGLARDAGHLAQASDVAVVLDEDALFADEALVRAAEALGEDALDLALYGGEDYALVAAGPTAPSGFRRIGEVREGQGILLRSPRGEVPVEAGGYDHFATVRRTMRAPAP
jgi:thiamine-monophosphate kinase